MAHATEAEPKRESDVMGTLMSLTVAFTLAMAFRGFVLEGFVIPTGSMGPTLMGAHIRFFSPITAYEYAADASPVTMADLSPYPIMDPMVSQRLRIAEATRAQLADTVRAGDRVLVLKPLFLMSEPQRWDVVVFKNPTDPVGDTQNYIKRLVGLPNETLLIVDGDIFTGALAAATDTLKIARKPEHVQRAVWQPIYNSDFEPVLPKDAMESLIRSKWPGPPWKAADATDASWTLAPNRAWSHTGSGKTQLAWDGNTWPIDDWSAYNALHIADMQSPPPRRDEMADLAWRGRFVYAVSDLRLAADIECADLASFSTEFTLGARGHIFRFQLSGSGTVHVQREQAESQEVFEKADFKFTPPTNGTLPVEFWHVDQQLWVFVNGTMIGKLPYEFDTLTQRVTSSMFGRTIEQYVRNHTDTRAPQPPTLHWSFDSKTPFTLHRVRVDRDLYYRPARHLSSNQIPINGPYQEGPAFATDWERPAQLGADDFLMLGDNSARSRDGRLWGAAHQLTRETFGESQPGVVPRQMIVGKAWCVYFPAPMPMQPGGTSLIPDFGRVRFIR